MTKDNPEKTSPETLVRSSPAAPVELTETDLDNVAGGRKAGKGQQEFLTVKLNPVLISSGN